MLTWSCARVLINELFLLSLFVHRVCVQPLFGEVKIDIKSQRLFLLFTNTAVSRAVILLRPFTEFAIGAYTVHEFS